MSNQEMQFADPDWKPHDQRDANIEAQQEEPYIPQPINAEQQEQQRWQTPPIEPGMYRGSSPYVWPPAQQIGGSVYRQPSYRRRSPLFWIIAALIIFSLIGGLGSFSKHSGDMHHAFPGGSGKPIASRTFLVNGGMPTVVIEGNTGNITVHADSTDTNSVIVGPTKGFNGFGDNPKDIQINQSSDSKTITINPSSDQDVDVTVPTNANLTIQVGSGNIEVDNVSGQMSLTTNSGNINAQEDTLSGQSTLKADNGSVTYRGNISSIGTYSFEATNSGSVDVALPSNPAFSVDATTSNGSINSDFSTVTVQQNGSGDTAHGDVGNKPQATVILQTDGGSIQLSQGSQ